MKEVFLKSHGLLKEIAGIKWVDLDKGQLESGGRAPVAFPCALIKVDQTRGDNLGGKVQHCVASLTIRLGFDFTGETSSVTPDAHMQSALAYFDVIENVYKKFQGNGDKKLSPFNRKSMREENRADGLKVIWITFETEYNDFTAAS